MSVLVVVATPSPGFGDLIRLTLQEEGNYRAIVTASAAATLQQVSDSGAQLVIVDADLEDQPFHELVTKLHALDPAPRIILIPPDNDPEHPDCEGLDLAGTLTKPFYLPDLQDTLKEALGETPPLPVAVPVPAQPAEQPQRKVATGSLAGTLPPAWLADAQQSLARLITIAGEIPAVLLHQGTLWAATPQVNATLLDGILAIARPGDEVERMAGLSDDAHNRQVYFVPLARGYSLAMTGRGLSFSRLRMQARQLAQELQTTEIDGTQTGQTSGAGAHSLLDDDQMLANADALINEAAQMLKALGMEDAPESETSSTEPKSMEEAEKAQPGTEAAPHQSAGELADDSQPARDFTPDDQAGWVYEAGSAEPASQTEPAAGEGEEPDYRTRPVNGAADRTAVDRTAVFFERQEAPVPNAAVTSDWNGGVIHRLHIACALAPRLPQHALEGELAGLLSEWMAQLCLAYGWRLEGLTVLPEVMQWIVRLPPETSPARMVNHLRRQTSQRVFNRYPEFATDNPSGDFWAPGYLMVSSRQHFQHRALDGYVNEVRRLQGIADRPPAVPPTV